MDSAKVFCFLILFVSSLVNSDSGSAVDTMDGYDVFTIGIGKMLLELIDRVKPSEQVKVTDPEAFMTTPEIIRYYGYPVEIHHIETRDGFILELHRIPGGRSNGTEFLFRPPVLVMHGMITSSAQWVINTPKVSLGFILANEGFDVWLGNFRANSYSKRHTRLSSTGPNYWKFSWEEMGRYDVRSMIDYILKLTQETDLAYIGHSMGSTAMAVTLSTYPEYNSKISQFIAISPAMFIGLDSFARYLAYYIDTFKLLTDLFGIYRVAPKGLVPRLLAPKKGYMYQLETAYEFYSAFVGFNREELNMTRFPTYVEHVPEAVSFRLLHHYAQMFLSDKFQTYDNGKKPPVEFNLSNVTAPVYLIWSPNDLVVTEAKVHKLEALLPNLKRSIRTKNPAYSHNDCYMGMNSKEVIVDEVLKILRNP